MLARWAQAVGHRRWWVIAIIVVLAGLGATASVGLADKLVQGGYDVPGSESDRALDTIEDEAGRQDADVVAVYRLPQGSTVRDPEVTAEVRKTIENLPADVVRSAHGWWDQPTLASKDGRTAAVSLQMRGESQDARFSGWQEVEHDLRGGTQGQVYGVDGLEVRFSGYSAMGTAVSEQAESDLIRAELISFPVLLILLVFVFRGLVAAALPLVVGGVGIVGALGVLRVFTELTDVSVFAMNVVTLLGLGLAIDYGLFVVSRFREERERLDRSGEPHVATEGVANDEQALVGTALARTLSTAGRTVLVSGLTVMVALSGLLLFPQAAVRSIGLGGMAAVFVAMLSAVTLLPALLAVLGRRVDALPVRRRASAVAERQGWRRFAGGVMRRPAVVAVGVVAVLLAVGTPFLRAEYSEVDASVLPKGHDVRVATEQLHDELPSASEDATLIALVGENGSQPHRQTVRAAMREIGAVDGVRRVMPSTSGGDVTVLQAQLAGDPQGESAQEAVKDIRNLEPPAGASDQLVGGTTARLLDSVGGIGDKLPWMLLMLAGSVLVLLFLAFGSVVVPVKAVLLSALSLTASFGAIVWIFQDGHFVELLGTEAGPIDATIPVLMLAVLFGLSTDYEVFLLSRIAEAYRSGRSPKEAVVHGLTRTGPLITAAAILLMVVIGAFSFSGLKFMKLMGIGMLIAIAVDATIVRGLLVPAVLALLGRAAWWAPGPLARFQRRFGLEAHEEVEASSADSADGADGAIAPDERSGVPDRG